MEFPSNSHRQREEETSEPKKDEVKKIERVVSGEVIRRKKPLSRRLKETFVGGDARSAWGYVVLDILIPAAKDMVVDATMGGLERTLFGESRSRSRRTGRSNPNGYVAYNRYSSSNSRPPWDREEPRREMPRRSRPASDIQDIILESRGEAEEVIDRLFDLVAKYESATVADLYELTGQTGNYTDDKWGWTDIRGAGVTRIRNGYLLDLPRPEPLD